MAVSNDFQALGIIDQALGGVRTSVQEHVLDQREKLRLDLLVDLKHPGIHDGHVETRLDRMVKESRVHCLAHRVVTTEGEGDIAQSAASLGPRKCRLDLADGLNEVDCVVVVLIDPGCDGEDVRIEDDVLGVESDPVHEQAIGAGADAHLLRLGGCLTLLVEGHDDHGGTVALGQPCTLEKSLLPVLEADGVEDTLALEALHSLLKDRPLGAVDHDRHAADLRIGGQEVQEGLHHRLAVEHPLVDVHIQDIGTALHLLACHREGGLVIARDDEFGETRRPGDVRPFPDHHEGTPLGDGQRLESAQSRGGQWGGGFAGWV